MIIQKDNEMLIGNDETGYTHLCFAEDYTEPYYINMDRIEALKCAVRLSEQDILALSMPL